MSGSMSNTQYKTIWANLSSGPATRLANGIRRSEHAVTLRQDVRKETKGALNGNKSVESSRGQT